MHRLEKAARWGVGGRDIDRHQRRALNGYFTDQSLDQLGRDATALKGRLTAERLNPDPVVPFRAYYHSDRLLPLQGDHAIPRPHVEERHVFFQTLLSHGRRIGVVHEITSVDRPDNQGKVVRAAETVRWHRPAFLPSSRCERTCQALSRQQPSKTLTLQRCLAFP